MKSALSAWTNCAVQSSVNAVSIRKPTQMFDAIFSFTKQCTIVYKIHME